MFDLRNHGESEYSNNKQCGVGMFEYHDVIGAMRYIKSRDDLKNLEIGFVSFCTGANATIVAMSKEKEVMADAKCLLAVQPVTLETFVRSYIKSSFTKLGVWTVFPLVKRFINWQCKYKAIDQSPRDYVKDINVPVLYIQARSDPWTELSDVENFYEKSPEPKELFILEGDLERFDTYNYVGEQPEKMLSFLENNWK